MIAENSARYRKQADAEREIPDGLASPAPLLPPVSKAQWKAEKEREEKPRLLYSVSKGKGRKRKPKTQEKRKRAKKPQSKE